MSNEIEKSGWTGALRMERRDFLRLSSVAALGAATTVLAEDGVRSLAGSFVHSPMPLLGIGYCTGAADAGHTGRLIPAERLSSGDDRFADRPVRLRVAGFRRADAHRRKPLSIALHVHYPGAAFIAWSSATRGSAMNIGSPVAATVPVDADHALVLSVESTMPRSAAVRTLTRRMLHGEGPRREVMEARLGFGKSDAPAKLRPGVYVLALRESDDDRAPDWSAIQYAPGSANPFDLAAVGPLRLSSLAEESPAPFSYLILTADHA